MRKALFIGIALLAVFGWVGVVAAHPLTPDAQGKTKKTRAPKTTEKSGKTAVDRNSLSKKADKLGPLAVFADIEEGWRKENVQTILRHYGKGKVAISIEGTGPVGGAFSKNQSHYVQYRNVSDSRKKVYAVAERSYKRNDDGRTFKDKIYVSLHLEGSRWVIGEIKSIR
jgi:hypothetical protein